MVDFIGKEILLDSFKEVFKLVLRKVRNEHFDTTKKVKLAEALTSINQAILETRCFIKNDGFKDNAKLSGLWHDALNKSITAGLKDGLPEYLYNKANFWGSPEEWLRNDASMEIVPKLNDLRKLCDSIMVILNK